MIVKGKHNIKITITRDDAELLARTRHHLSTSDMRQFERLTQSIASAVEDYLGRTGGE